MTIRNVLTTGCAAWLCLAATTARSPGENRPVHEQRIESTLNPNTNDRDFGRDREGIGRASPDARSDRSLEHGLTKVQKASGLIGMDVHSEQDEKLGAIKDVVLDLPTGRVAYVVLSTGGFLGLGDRMIAIPPDAFRMSADGAHLVLADKPKIMNAPSFARTSWPAAHSTDFVDYWRMGSRADAIGGPSAGVAVGSATGESSPHLRKESRLPSDRTSREHHVFKGKIAAINPETRTLTIEGAEGTREFMIAKRPILTLKENRTPHLIDFKVGFPVAVGFHEDEHGNLIAHSVIRTDAPEVK